MSYLGQINEYKESEDWDLYKERLVQFYIVNDIEDDKMVPALLSLVGPKTYLLLKNLTSPEEPANKTFDELCTLLQAHYKPKPLVIAERYRFHNRNQKEGESAQQFLAELRQLAMTCEFKAFLEEALRDRFVCGIRHSGIQKKLLSQAKLTTEKALELATSIETAERDLTEIQKESQVSSVQHKKSGWHPRSQRSKSRNRTGHTCQRCGRSHKYGECPAYGATCDYCKGKNHWSTVCKKKPKDDSHQQEKTRKPKRRSREVHSVHQEESDSEEEKNTYLHSVKTMKLDSVSGDNGKLIMNLHVSSKHVRTRMSFKVDTGAEADCLPISMYRKLYPEAVFENGKPVNLNNDPNVRLIAYNGMSITQYGKCDVTLYHKGKKVKTSMYVVSTGAALLSLQTSTKLGLIIVNCDTNTIDKDVTQTQGHDDTDFYSNDEEKEKSKRDKDKVLEQYPDLFEGIGCFEGECSIHIDTNKPPHVYPPRQIAQALQKPLKEELGKMVQQGVIKPLTADEPAEWVNSFVCVSKPDNTIRFCLDPTRLNEAIIRPYHYTPTIEDLLPKLNNAKYFTIVDARSGYWSLKLDEKSSYLTTFSCMYGRYRFLRLPFGLSCSADLFQKKIDETYSDLPGVCGIADDMVIVGYKEDGSDHDENLRRFLERTRLKNVKLNPNKCRIKCTKIPFFGMVIGKNGLEPDPKKVNAVMDMKPPTTVKELQSFLGVVNYLSRFSPHISELTAPLRPLLKKENQFAWYPSHQQAFNSLKAELSSTRILKYFDETKPLFLEVDASGRGLGAALLQKCEKDDGRGDLQPIAYASKALTEAETRYANIEREMLAILFGLERFHYYTYGRKITVITDHKPLVAIASKALSQAPPRLSRMLLRMQKYIFQLEYQPGKHVKLADALSRLDPVPGEEIDVNLTVHEFQAELNASSSRLSQIREETEKDGELSQLKRTVNDGWPRDRGECPVQLHAYWNFRDEISVIDGILTKGTRIIIPVKLRPEIMKQIHYGHLGIEKCRLRARSCVYWPSINKDIEMLVNACEACQKYQNSKQKETLKQHEVPPEPWHTIGTDIFFLNNKSYLICVDYYSKFPTMRRLRSITAKEVIKQMKHIFEEHGICKKLVSDSGAQFSSAEFKRFTKDYDFEHVMSSPHHQQSNGMAERTIQTIKRILKKCKDTGEDPYLAILCYKTTPIDGKLASPAELLNGRKFKANLPKLEMTLQRDVEHDRERLIERQQKQKFLHDRHAKDVPRLTEEQLISIQDPQTKRWTPGKVNKVESDRSYIVETERGSQLKRNKHFIKTRLVNSKDRSTRHSTRTDIDLDTDCYRQEEENNRENVDRTQSTSTPVKIKKKVTFQDEPVVATSSGRVVKKPLKLDL